MKREFKSPTTNKKSNKIIKLKLEKYIDNIFSENTTNEYLTFQEFGLILFDLGILKYLFNKNYQNNFNYSEAIMDLQLMRDFFVKECRSIFNLAELESEVLFM